MDCDGRALAETDRALRRALSARRLSFALPTWS